MKNNPISKLNSVNEFNRIIKVVNNVKYKTHNEKLSKTIDEMREFGKSCGLILKSDEETESGNYDKRQLIKNIIMTSFTLLTGVRFIITASMAEELVVVLMSDSIYLVSVGQNIHDVIVRLAQLVFGVTALIISAISIFLLKRELDGTSELMNFFHEYENNLLIPMNAKNTYLLEREFFILCKLFKPLFWTLTTLLMLLIPGLNILAYFIGKFNYNIMSLIFWSLCSLPFTIQTSCIICLGAVGWVVPVHYLIYKFNELTYKTVNIRDFSMTEIIINHSKICTKTKSMSDFFGFVIFLLYYFAPIGIVTTIYITHSSNVIPVARLVIISLILFNFVNLEYLQAWFL